MSQKTQEAKIPSRKRYARPGSARANGNYLLPATIYIDSTVDSALFVAATGGLDVDAIPNEVTTRIILNSSKSSILAQAINIGAKGVK
jgi:hypothetical protein